MERWAVRVRAPSGRRRGDALATAFRRRNSGASGARVRVRAGGCGDGPCH